MAVRQPDTQHQPSGHPVTKLAERRASIQGTHQAEPTSSSHWPDFKHLPGSRQAEQKNSITVSWSKNDVDLSNNNKAMTVARYQPGANVPIRGFFGAGWRFEAA